MANASAGKPELLWVKRVGTGNSRDDSKNSAIFDTIERIFSKRFHFSFLSPEHFEEATNGHKQVQELLKRIHRADVMVGLYGAGLWNSLFMKENSIHVELKSHYGYCGQENGRILANHNNMLFYQGDARAFAREHVGVPYSDVFLKQLAKELVDAVAYRERHGFLTNSTDDDWRGNCTFIYPPKGFVEGRRILSHNNMTRCYLDEVETGRWYQMRSKGGRSKYCEGHEISLPSPLTMTESVGGKDTCPGKCFQ